MYLMDYINRMGTLVRIQRASDPLLGIYPDVAERLEGAPRFLLDAAATRTAVELNLARPKVTREAMAHLRIPYPKLWVEWDDADRQKLREKFDEPMSYAELRPMPGRVGFLLEADKGGRAGTAIWAWTTPPHDVPNIGCVQPYFDLDRNFPMSEDRITGLLKGNLAHLWMDNPVQLEALFDIWRTTRHAPSEWGAKYLSVFGKDSLATSLAYADVVGEYIMIWAVMLMLTASRPILWETPVDMSRLNRHRARKGEIPLLDHTRISLRMTPREDRPVIRSELGYTRKSPRVHLVSSYLARRGDKHWCVFPYWRGKGEVIHRVVDVKG